MSCTTLSNSAFSYLFEILQTNKYLISLNVGNNKLINKNKISETVSEKLKDFLATNKILICLNLSGLGLSEKTLKNMCEGLSLNSTLLHLNISKNSIGPWGGCLLSRACQTANLESLNLSNNFLGDQGIRDFAVYLESKLRPSTLKLLDIGYNTFGRMGFGNLSDRLSRNFNLQELILEGNALSGKRLITLKNFLPNSSISHLNLHNCELDDESIEMIKHGLKKNTALRTLNLSKNFIYAKGVKVLTDALFGHHNLRNLFLNQNRIGNQCLNSILELMNEEHKLENLELSNNLLTEISANQILQVLRENNSLKSLNIKNNSFNFQQAVKMEEIIQKRSKIFNLQKNEKVEIEINNLKEFTSQRNKFENNLEEKKNQNFEIDLSLNFYLQEISVNKQIDKEKINKLEEELLFLMNETKYESDKVYILEENKAEFFKKGHGDF